MKVEIRSFLFKLFNLILVACILFAYQAYAAKRQKKADTYAEELAEYKKAVAEAEHKYQDGVYEGSGMGYGGEIKVSVTIEDHTLKRIEVLSAAKETPEYLAAAEKLLDEIVAVQSVDVDTVTGATLSSNGILEGVEEALKKSEG
ncbi:MAG: FMN-binding protein [Lachnospiraceae bacterium]|nr:FMN-binding protein [Lachnospiraceae bacterium]